MAIKVINTIVTNIGYDFYADVAERIVSMRNKRGMTQDDLAKKANVEKGLLGRYERVSARMRKPVLEKLADALGVSFDWIIGAEFDDEDMGVCLYTVRNKRYLDREFEIYFDAKSPQEAFLTAYEWSFEVGFIWLECRDRAVVTLKAVPVHKKDISQFQKRNADVDDLENEEAKENG